MISASAHTVGAIVGEHNNRAKGHGLLMREWARCFALLALYSLPHVFSRPSRNVRSVGTVESYKRAASLQCFVANRPTSSRPSIRLPQRSTAGGLLYLITKNLLRRSFEHYQKQQLRYRKVLNRSTNR